MRNLFVIFLGIGFLNASALEVSDHFDSASGNWNTIFGKSQVTGGKFELTGDTLQPFAWSILTGATFGDFSLKVTATFDSTTSQAIGGISFRTQGNTDCYRIFFYSDGTYFLEKYIGSQQIGFFAARKSNSFILGTSNQIEIIGLGNTFSFLCNGQLFYTLKDSSITEPGQVGLLVLGKNLKMLFDDLSLSDSATPNIGLNSFTDSFDDPSLFGWRNYTGKGVFRTVSGSLEASGDNTTYFSILQSDGNYGSADTIQVSAEKISGDATSGYGLMYHYNTVVIDSVLRTVGYIFTILNGSYFTVLKNDGLGVTQLFNVGPSTAIYASAKNVFKVINTPGGQMDIYANGTKIKTLTDNSFPSGGVGLMVQGNLKVNFDDFKISRDALGTGLASLPVALAGTQALTVVPNPARGLVRITPLAEGNNLPLHIGIYDVGGKLVEKLNLKNGEAHWNGAAFPVGVYLVKAETATQKTIRRLVLLK